MAFFDRMMEASPFGPVGIVTAAILVFLLFVLLPAKNRRWVQLPLTVLVLHVIIIIVLASVTGPNRRTALHYGKPIALLLLLLSMGRSGFLLVMHSVVSRQLTRPLPKIFSDILQGFVYLGVIMITLRAAGFAPGSILATSAVLTAVLGLSLQDTLGNVFSGLAIQLQRPFDVGDWIQFDENSKHVGRVLEINWRATKVLTLDHIEVTVPNSALAKAPISNFTKPTNTSRRNVYVTAPFDVAPRRVHDVLVDAVSDMPGILRDPAPSVVINEFTERGIEYRLRFFTNEFQSREHLDGTVRERMWYALRRANIHIPIPTRTIFAREVTAETEAQKQEVGVSQREQALGYVDFLKDLPQPILHRLAMLSETRLYAAGEVVLKQGDEGAELFIIWHGEVAVVLHKAGEGSVEIARLGPGKFVGEMSLMTGEHRTATVKATEPCEMIVVGKNAFRQILEEMPELARSISNVLAARREELGERAAAMDADDAISREERSGILLARIKDFFSLR